jgi:hypothetical protein
LKIPRQNIKIDFSPSSLLLACFLCVGGNTAAGNLWLSSTNSLAWLNTQTSFGAGTLQNPYYGDFDYIMGHFVPINATVQLGGGIFWTKGNGFGIPAGVTVQGEGEAFTTVRRATNFAGYVQANMYLFDSAYSNITVRNLTVDCNAFDFVSRKWTNSIGAVNLTGSGETMEHVTDINGFGLQFAEEGFQLAIGYYGQSGNKVIGCTVSNFLGTYGDGIAPAGDSLIEGNSIYLPIRQAGQPFQPLFGINVVSSAKGSQVIGNYVYGGGDAFHNDTGGDTNVVIANNVFENVVQGVDLTGDQKPYNSIIISHNLITQNTNYAPFGERCFLITIDTLQEGETNHNIVVDGNILRFYNNVPFTSDGSQGAMYINTETNYGFNHLNENISIINNQIDARMPVVIIGNISNLFATGNIPLNGTNFATAKGQPGLTNFVPGQ